MYLLRKPVWVGALALMAMAMSVVLFNSFSDGGILKGRQDIYSWNQRVTLIITTEEGTFSSSTIQRVTWERNSAQSFNPAAPLWLSTIEGEMPFFPMSNGEFVLSLFGNSNGDRLSTLLPVDRVEPLTTIDPLSLQDVVQAENSTRTVCVGDSEMPYVLIVSHDGESPSIRRFTEHTACIQVEKVAEELPTAGQIERVFPWISAAPTTRGFDPEMEFPSGQQNADGNDILSSLSRRDVSRGAY